MTPKTAESKPRRKRALFGLDDAQLLPTDLDLPKPIAEANRLAIAARDHWYSLTAKANELGEQAKAAPHFDELAAEAAIAAGEDPPAATAAAKRAAADEARKAADAAETVTRQRVSDLYDAVDEHFDEYLARRESEAAELRESIQSLVPDALDRLVRYQRAQAMLVTARRFHNNPTSAALSAGVGGLERQYERELAEQRKRAALRPNYAVTASEAHSLLAALTIILERDELAA